MEKHFSPKEKHFFLPDNTGAVYYVEYLPSTEKNRHFGVILCKPIWGERIRTHRIFTNLARLLQDNGFTVITCDYFGDGNSGGDTLDLHFEGMTTNIVSLQEHLLQQSQLTNFAVIGLRIGANCALAAAPKLASLKKIILVEPVPDLEKYLFAVLRSNLSTQMTTHKKIIKTREMLIEDINNDMPVNADGFLIGKKLWESFRHSAQPAFASNLEGEITILMLGKEGTPRTCEKLFGGDHAVKMDSIAKEFFWDGWKKNVQRPPLFFAKIEELLLSEISL